MIAAAISAQFSAAIADTSGTGGLLADLTRGWISMRTGYVLLVTAGLAMTWTLSVFEIIGYASRAFALYFAIQAFTAAKGASVQGGSVGKVASFTALGLLGLAIVVFGAPVE